MGLRALRSFSRNARSFRPRLRMSTWHSDPRYCGVYAEPLHRYRPGGYHPIHLGDTFHNDRYRVIHKLGFGGYSTVWLARDEISNRNVALKVSVAEEGNAVNREHQFLSILSRSANAPGSKHIVDLYDHFTHNGPNGTHDCLVLELLGRNVADVTEEEYEGNRLPGSLAKAISKQVLLGVGFIHQHGIGHGVKTLTRTDLHVRNVAFTCPEFGQVSEAKILDRLGLPETSAVTRHDGTPLDPGTPSYLVWPVSLPFKTTNAKHEIKIIDFGQAFPVKSMPKTLHTPLQLRAPELLFDDKWDCRVDLWSMGCMIFELVTGHAPFNGIMLDKPGLARQMTELLGELPLRWRRTHLAFLQSKYDTYKEEHPLNLQELLEEVYFEDGKDSQFSQKDIERLGPLLERLIRFEPSTRVAANEALSDPWFTD